MNKLRIPYFKAISAQQDELEQLFSELPGQAIDQQPWPEFPSITSAQFKMAYTDDALLLNYQVEEQFLRINSFVSNDPVWEDSCVEFFISFQEDLYYNLEFNALGVGLVGYGAKNKSMRERFPEQHIAAIQSYSHIRKDMQGEGIRWNLGLYIPSSIFQHEKIQSWSRLTCRANFYKCGDLLPNPHFQSWSPIVHPSPNFHLPEFFGTLEFE